ncbi:MAG: Rieske (2Fe-2S) protein, partial [Betaproteobacteria bacterium]|nr:Rieske (2Fe-2S) protein [Betaproteobacteria bacterium]
MSAPGQIGALTRPTTQLPVSAYFDTGLFQLEIERLFKAGPAYVGHELMVPEMGNYFALPAEHEGRVLIRNQHGIECLSNVCRHRQAIMLKGKGHVEQLVCPLHRWTYDLQGQLLGAPHFEQQPCLNLPKTPLQAWKGLLFEGRRDIAADLGAMKAGEHFNFESYCFDHVE